MPTPDPLVLVAELTYACPLHCPYCSNPLDLTRVARQRELSTEEWTDVMRQAAAMGVLQVGLSGGEPLVRCDLPQIVAAAAGAGLYTNLITGATMLSAARLDALRSAGLDHIQISLQDSDPAGADRIAGARAHKRKLRAARDVRARGMPLTINVVLHRYNIERLEEIVDLCAELGGARLELAHTQYHGWAARNQRLLMPTPEQLVAAEQALARARARHAGRFEIVYVLPDIYEELPKPCMGGWGRIAMVVAPDGRVLPCHAAASIPGVTFATIRHTPLAEIWRDSEAFQRFRGDAWMREPCRSCPLARQHIDFGGCRCQAFRLTGDAAATDPVCHLSPEHGSVRFPAAIDELAFRRVSAAPLDKRLRR
jgi:PqqA peptide cyclase